MRNEVSHTVLIAMGIYWFNWLSQNIRVVRVNGCAIVCVCVGVLCMYIGYVCLCVYACICVHQLVYDCVSLCRHISLISQFVTLFFSLSPSLYISLFLSFSLFVCVCVVCGYENVLLSDNYFLVSQLQNGFKHNLLRWWSS